MILSDNGKITQKDMSTAREADSAKVAHKQNTGVLRDYSMEHRVEMRWEPGLDHRKDSVIPFKLRIDDTEAILDWREFIQLGRDRAMGGLGFFYADPISSYEQRFYRLQNLDGPRVALSLALGEEAERDLIFRLQLDDLEVLLDYEQLVRYGRFI